MRVGGAGDRGGIGRLVREEADSFFWNGFLGGRSVLTGDCWAQGKGWDPRFPVKWFEAIHSSASTSPRATHRGDLEV